MAMVEKRTGFSPVELSYLEEKHKRLLTDVIPMYRGLSQAGQIELSATPFYHPILPLLIDAGVARCPQPQDPLPNFSFPQDAQEQVRRAIAHHEAMFGKKPVGMWPAEGAVSPGAAQTFAQEGLAWIATDAEILAKSLGRPPKPSELYRPWRSSTERGDIAIFFRDSILSNRISFDYHAWKPENATADIIDRLRGISENWQGDAPPLVLIAMDGENAWDSYDRNGRPFLTTLYRRIMAEPKLELIPVGEYLARFGTGSTLRSLWSGSWINADFRTWIGTPPANRAWAELAFARQAAEQNDQGRKKRAMEHIYVTEGSDWFWWYSPTHSSPQDAEFDLLFRERLAWAYRELGMEPNQGLTERIK
jgi:alpha-amylase/alpha-mannosidase (GH57 family)